MCPVIDAPSAAFAPINPSPKPAMCAGAVVGMCCGIASWLATAQIMSGSIDIISTGLNPPLLAGNIIAFGVSLFLVVGISLIFPAKSLFDWVLLKEQITTTEDTVHSLPNHRCACMLYRDGI